MGEEELHPWNVSLLEAAEIQRRLSGQIRLKDEFEAFSIISGVGLAFKPELGQLVVATSSYSFPDLKLVQSLVRREPVFFPYRSGYLAFTAGPAILSVFGVLKRPQLVIFPGRGIVHPRGLGLASHLGIWLNLSTIACAKRPIVKDYQMPALAKGSFALFSGKLARYGAVLRTQTGIKPIFVAPGHKISLSRAVDIVLRCCTKYRLPEPLRVAGILARRG